MVARAGLRGRRDGGEEEPRIRHGGGAPGSGEAAVVVLARRDDAAAARPLARASHRSTALPARARLSAVLARRPHPPTPRRCMRHPPRAATLSRHAPTAARCPPVASSSAALSTGGLEVDARARSLLRRLASLARPCLLEHKEKRERE